MTLKDKLLDIIELNGGASEYMSEMLQLIENILKYDSEIRSTKVSVFWEENGSLHEDSYYLEHCIGELVLNKGKVILDKLTWLN